MANGQGGLNGIEAISGAQPASTAAVEKITLQNIEGYDYTKANRLGNQTQFLGITAQTTTTKFDSRNIDIVFNDGGNNVGLNPFFKPPETATRIFTA